MTLKNIIIGGLIASGITGGALRILYIDKQFKKFFEYSEKPIVGTVLEESYQNTLLPVPNWNEIVSCSSYTLKIQTDDSRIIGVSVIDGDDLEGRPVKKESLDAIIEKGTRISFPCGNVRHGYLLHGTAHRYYSNETFFTPETQAGNKRADRIKVMSEE